MPKKIDRTELLNKKFFDITDAKDFFVKEGINEERLRVGSIYNERLQHHTPALFLGKDETPLTIPSIDERKRVLHFHCKSHAVRVLEAEGLL